VELLCQLGVAMAEARKVVRFRAVSGQAVNIGPRLRDFRLKRGPLRVVLRDRLAEAFVGDSAARVILIEFAGYAV
jgi:hypothetical protein